MLLGHRVGDGEETFVLHPLEGKGVAVVCCLGLQRRQGDATAGDGSAPRGVEDIAANRANVEMGAQQIARHVLVSRLQDTFWLVITLPESNSATDTPSAPASGSMRVMSGSPLAVSHLDTALAVTPMMSASWACVMPLPSRRRRMVAPVM